MWRKLSGANSIKGGCRNSLTQSGVFLPYVQKCMGVTFLEYVNQVRINHIHEELLATEDSITDILEHNGFTNYKVFSRMFKAQFGMTPRELRKLQEN